MWLLRSCNQEKLISVLLRILLLLCGIQQLEFGIFSTEENNLYKEKQEINGILSFPGQAVQSVYYRNLIFQKLVLLKKLGFYIGQISIIS